MEIGGPDSVSIVPMTAEMVPQVAKLHMEAFSEHMSTRLGVRYVSSFINWFCHEKTAIALVAITSNRELVGYVIGSSVDCGASLNRDLFWIAAAEIMLRPWLLLDGHFLRTLAHRVRLIVGFSAEHHSAPVLPKPVMSLVGIGILPSARGKKIGFRLMQAFEARTWDLKVGSLRLSVYPDNIVARQLYEHCGWQPFIKPRTKKETMYYFRVLSKDSR